MTVSSWRIESSLSVLARFLLRLAVAGVDGAVAEEVSAPDSRPDCSPLSDSPDSALAVVGAAAGGRLVRGLVQGEAEEACRPGE